MFGARNKSPAAQRVCEKVFKKPCFLASCQASEEDPDADEIDESLSAASEPLAVLALAPLSPQPGKGPLHDPALGDDAEAWLVAEISGNLWGITPRRSWRNEG